jgi:AraC family transcriptional regulator
MDTDKHFGNTILHSDELNAPGRKLVSPEPMREAITNDLSIVAAQLLEAACKARDGDREAARAHIAHAVAILHGNPSVGPSAAHALPRGERQDTRGGLAAWQARRVIAHIDANLDRRIRIQELAKLLGLCASHFCRTFKHTFGASPRTYVLRRRIERAQGLMLTTRDSLSSIALTCGMCDQSHFANVFYRIVGETPYSWRRTRRAELEDRTDISERCVVRPPPATSLLLSQRPRGLPMP